MKKKSLIFFAISFLIAIVLSLLIFSENYSRVTEGFLNPIDYHQNVNRISENESKFKKKIIITSPSNVFPTISREIEKQIDKVLKTGMSYDKVAEILRDNGYEEEAIKYARKYLRTNCCEIDGLYTISTLLDDRETEVAEEIFKNSAINVFTESRDIKHVDDLFDYFIASEQKSKAASLIIDLEHSFPEDFQLITKLGSFYEKEGDYSRAIEQYESLLKTDNNETFIYLILGNLYLKQGDITQGKKYLTHVISQSPELRDEALNLMEML